MIIPRGKTIIAELNSYYTNIERLCEYYHELIGACGIEFRSPSALGILFFDRSDYIGGGFKKTKALEFDTDDPIENLISAAARENFDVTVYEISSDKVYYWYTLLHAKSKYDGLKSDFTNLHALIKQMKTEALNGYIEILFKNKHYGDIFFENGTIVHCHCLDNGVPPKNNYDGDKNLTALLCLSNKKQSIFNVKEVNNTPFAGDVVRTFAMLEGVLGSLGQVLSKNQSRGYDFNLTLKKKFIEKADTYAFLDPFADEFHYNGSKIFYKGSVDVSDVAEAVIETARELANENSRSNQFESELKSLKAQFPTELINLNYGT